MTAQDDALLKALNDAMLDFNRACTREDAEGDPRDWVHAAYLHAWKAGRAYEASRATADRAELEALIERVVFALNLGGNGTLEEADKVERDHGNQLANLCLDLCAALGRGHRAAAPTAERRPADDGDGGA